MLKVRSQILMPAQDTRYSLSCLSSQHPLVFLSLVGTHYLVGKRVKADLLFSPSPFFLPYFHVAVIKARHMLSLLGVSTWDIKDGDDLVPADSSLLSRRGNEMTNTEEQPVTSPAGVKVL